MHNVQKPITSFSFSFLDENTLVHVTAKTPSLITRSQLTNPLLITGR